MIKEIIPKTELREMQMRRPILLVFEGVDATGKTTLAKRLARELKVEYIRGGGWFGESDLAKRSTREGSRDFYYSLMQMRQVRETKAKLEESKRKEGIVGILDRLVLVDVAHRLAFEYDGFNDFTEKATDKARQALRKFIPEGVWGIVLDVGDKEVVSGRILSKMSLEGKSVPTGADFLSWLREHGYLPEADTLGRFAAKRAAWLWCAQELKWPVVDASGSEEKVYGKVKTLLEEKGFWPEGQAKSPEGSRKEVE
ncbi:MAG: hypothetical protein ABH867_04825 [Patescibacteria group bacterium]|nr:hypothetical protein [Patescibacteria group bacterium]